MERQTGTCPPARRGPRRTLRGHSTSDASSWDPRRARRASGLRRSRVVPAARGDPGNRGNVVLGHQGCASVEDRIAPLIPVPRAFSAEVITLLVVPLLQPRHQLEQPREQRHQPVRRPAILGLALVMEGSSLASASRGGSAGPTLLAKSLPRRPDVAVLHLGALPIAPRVHLADHIVDRFGVGAVAHHPVHRAE